MTINDKPNNNVSLLSTKELKNGYGKKLGKEVKLDNLKELDDITSESVTRFIRNLQSAAKPSVPSPARQSPTRQSPTRQSPARQSPTRQSPTRQSPARQSANIYPSLSETSVISVPSNNNRIQLPNRQITDTTSEQISDTTSEQIINDITDRLYNLKVKCSSQQEQKGGELLNYNNIKQKAHIEVSNYINNDISKYENNLDNTETDTEVFLQNINNKLNELGGGNMELNSNSNSNLNSNVSTEQFLDYVENKLNNNLKGGDINNILQDSFVKGMNKGGYLENDTITQQDILNRIRMSGGRNDDDVDVDDDESDESNDSDDDSDDETESDSSDDKDKSDSDNKSSKMDKKKTSSSSSSDNALLYDSDNNNSDNETSESSESSQSSKSSETDKQDMDGGKHNDSSTSSNDSKSSDSKSSSDSSESSSSSSSTKINYTTGPSAKRVNKTEYDSESDEDSLSSIIVSSEDKSVTPYMMSSSSLKTEDINLISFSPKKESKKSNKKSNKKSSKKSSKKSKK
jgi:hypothetical protein